MGNYLNIDATLKTSTDLNEHTVISIIAFIHRHRLHLHSPHYTILCINSNICRINRKAMSRGISTASIIMAQRKLPMRNSSILTLIRSSRRRARTAGRWLWARSRARRTWKKRSWKAARLVSLCGVVSSQLILSVIVSCVVVSHYYYSDEERYNGESESLKRQQRQRLAHSLRAGQQRCAQRRRLCHSIPMDRSNSIRSSIDVSTSKNCFFFSSFFFFCSSKYSFSQFNVIWISLKWITLWLPKSSIVNAPPMPKTTLRARPVAICRAATTLARSPTPANERRTTANRHAARVQCARSLVAALRHVRHAFDVVHVLDTRRAWRHQAWWRPLRSFPRTTQHCVWCDVASW